MISSLFSVFCTCNIFSTCTEEDTHREEDVSLLTNDIDNKDTSSSVLKSPVENSRLAQLPRLPQTAIKILEQYNPILHYLQLDISDETYQLLLKDRSNVDFAIQFENEDEFFVSKYLARYNLSRENMTEKSHSVVCSLANRLFNETKNIILLNKISNKVSKRIVPNNTDSITPTRVSLYFNSATTLYDITIQLIYNKKGLKCYGEGKFYLELTMEDGRKLNVLKSQSLFDYERLPGIVELGQIKPEFSRLITEKQFDQMKLNFVLNS